MNLGVQGIQKTGLCKKTLVLLTQPHFIWNAMLEQFYFVLPINFLMTGDRATRSTPAISAYNANSL